MKQQRMVKLTNKMVIGGKTVFVNDQHGIMITKSADEKTIKVSTTKGQYFLTKHMNQDYYYGSMNGVKAHVMLKVLVGKIIFWA